MLHPTWHPVAVVVRWQMVHLLVPSARQLLAVAIRNITLNIRLRLVQHPVTPKVTFVIVLQKTSFRWRLTLLGVWSKTLLKIPLQARVLNISHYSSDSRGFANSACCEADAVGTSAESKSKATDPENLVAVEERTSYKLWDPCFDKSSRCVSACDSASDPVVASAAADEVAEMWGEERP